jgi:hypothetical protein
VPDGVRRVLGGKFLDAALKAENLMKKAMMNVLASMRAGSAIPDIAVERFDNYVDDGITTGLEAALTDLRVLVLRAQNKK